MPFQSSRTAVLAMDLQVGVVSVYVKAKEHFLGCASNVLAAARKARMSVVHVQLSFREGLPEVSSRNRLLASITAADPGLQLFRGASGAIHPQLGPEPGDIVVTKHRVSAFKGSDLAMVLRAKDVDTLVLFGISTSGVVLSTLLEASDADFKIVVLADCCADSDSVLHEVLLQRLFPRRAEILTSTEFIQGLA